MITRISSLTLRQQVVCFHLTMLKILMINPRSDVEDVNKDTGRLIAIDYLDRKNTLNQNMVVIGTSGVGKTTYMVLK